MNLQNEITPELPSEKEPLLSKATEVPPPHWATIRLQNTFHVFEKNGKDYFAEGMQMILDNALKRDFGTFEDLLAFFSKGRGELQISLVRSFLNDIRSDLELAREFQETPSLNALWYELCLESFVPKSEVLSKLTELKSQKSGRMPQNIQDDVTRFISSFHTEISSHQGQNISWSDATTGWYAAIILAAEQMEMREAWEQRIQFFKWSETVKSDYISHIEQNMVVFRQTVQSYLEKFKNSKDKINNEAKLPHIWKLVLDGLENSIHELNTLSRHSKIKTTALDKALRIDLYYNICHWLNHLTEMNEKSFGRLRSGVLRSTFWVYCPEHANDIEKFMKRQKKESLPLSTTVVLQGKAISLTSIKIKEGELLENGEWWHTNPTYFPVIKAELQRLYEMLPEKKTPDGSDGLLAVCARIHWLSANACFFDRGSASIAQLVTAWILEKHGKPMGLSLAPWTKMPDIMAFVTPLGEYIKAYSSGAYGGFRVK